MAQTVKIISDSTCDLSKDLLEKYDIETIVHNLYIIGDGSGVTHSLSHASASGVYVAREILESMRK